MTKELETGGPAFPAQPIMQMPHGVTNVISQEGMTTRTYAAIHLRVPMSEHDWLNDMIRESQRAELAKAAMQGMCALRLNEAAWTWRAFSVADAMLAEQENK